MIGGYDIILDSSIDPQDSLAEAFRLLRQFWPNAVVEDGDTGELLAPSETFFGLDAIMIYKDASARQSWDELGAEPINANTMIHVLASPGSMTVVVDNPDDPAAKYLIGHMRAFLAKVPARVST